MQQHGLSRHRLKLLKDLDAVLDGDAALGPPRRDDLDHHVAHLPSLDVLQKALEDRGLGALGVHLDERDVPPILEDGVRKDDAAAGDGGAAAHATCTTALLRARIHFLQALVPPGAVADVLGVVFDDVGFLAQAQVEEVHAARQARVVGDVLAHPGEARALQLEAVHGRAVCRGEEREAARVDPDVATVASSALPAAGTAAVAGAAAATAVAIDAGDVSFSANPASSSLPSQPPRLLPRLPPRASIPARSTTRVLSSETYLRRLFVTASLAHVLSVDACLPRSMSRRRKIYPRAASKGGGWGGEHEGQRLEGAGCGTGQAAGLAREGGGGQGWGRHEEAVRRDIGGIHSNSAETNRHVATTRIDATHVSSELFKRSLPVTLIDSAGQLWSMTYLPSKPDNLHSGRLVDGWETFCSANGLRIGDAVEFTRVEAHEQEPRWHGKELVARVVVLKKDRRNR